MEKITTLDLAAAFKALDEIEIPQVEGIKNAQALREAVKMAPKADALVEDYYNVTSKEELEQAKEAREEEIAKAKLAKIEKIVDLDADSPEELQPTYVGKTIIQCPQCMTLFYKDANDIEVSEENPEVVNVGEVCQHCGNASGYSVIGKVAEIEPEEAENFEEPAPQPEENELDLNFEEPNTDGTETDLEEVEIEEEPKVESLTSKLADTLTEEFESTLTEATVSTIAAELGKDEKFNKISASTLKKLINACAEDTSRHPNDVTAEDFKEWFGDSIAEIIFAFGDKLSELEIRKLGILDPKFIEACKAVEEFNLTHNDTDYEIDDEEVVELAVGDGSPEWIKEIETEYKKLHEETIQEDTKAEDADKVVKEIINTWESINKSDAATPAEDTEHHSENTTLNEETSDETAPDTAEESEEEPEELPEVNFTTSEVTEIAKEVAEEVAPEIIPEDEKEEVISTAVEEVVETAVEEKLEATEEPIDSTEVAVEEPATEEPIEEHIQDRPAAVESTQELQGTDNAVVDCEVATVIAHTEDEKPLDCEMKKPALEEPLAGEKVDVSIKESWGIDAMIAKSESIGDPIEVGSEQFGDGPYYDGDRFIGIFKVKDTGEYWALSWGETESSQGPIEDSEEIVASGCKSEEEIMAVLKEDGWLKEELTEADEKLPEVTDATVEKLLDSPEFKKPISEEEVENIIAKEETTESLNKSEQAKPEEDTEHHSENLTLNEETNESVNTSEVQKDAEEGSELKTEEESKNLTLNEETTDESLNTSEAQKDAAEHSELETENHSEELTLNEDLDSDMNKYNEYVAYLRAMLKQDEEALEKAKKLKDNEFAIKVIEKRIAADKEDLEAALPSVVKDKQAEDELPSPEEVKVEETVTEEQPIVDTSKEEVQECAKQPKTLESLDEIEDKALTECISKSLTNVYENVDSFILTNCELANNNLIVEGKINFKSGLSKDTKYVFTEAIINDTTAELKGCNEGLAENSEFKLCGSINENILIAESLSYKYNIGEELVEGLASIK